MLVTNGKTENGVGTGTHLINMCADHYRGLVQDTAYDDIYPPEIQERQVTYTGLMLANVSKLNNLAEAAVTICETWADLEKPMRKTDHRFSRNEYVKLRIMHRADKMDAILNYWHNYYPNSESKWLRQPCFHGLDTIAWLMPTPNPAILYKPGNDNRDSVIRFIQGYKDRITRAETKPEDWTHPNYTG